MTTLEIEPTYRVVLGETDVFRIMLVGVGGTGLTLVRLCSWPVWLITPGRKAFRWS